ncbi:MAG TPA: LysE family translocator [Roseiarcus sp.]
MRSSRSPARSTCFGLRGGPFATGRRSSSRPGAPAGGGLRGAFANGLLINLTNPKIVLFFVTFLPQFISASDPHASAKLFLLGFGFIAITTVVNAIVVLVAGQFVAAAKRNPRALRLFDYGFAALMSAFAARLVWDEAR